MPMHAIAALHDKRRQKPHALDTHAISSAEVKSSACACAMQSTHLRGRSFEYDRIIDSCALMKLWFKIAAC